MKAATLILVFVAVVTAGCGSTAQHAATTRSTTTVASRSTSLVAAVRAALLAHHQLSARVLWTNTVPRQSTVIGGPALTSLRAAAATRRTRQIRVKLQSETFQVVSIRIDPSYTRATARVSDRQHVRPYGYDDKPLGKSVTLNEDATIVLHRIGATRHFLVWKVTLTR